MTTVSSFTLADLAVMSNAELRKVWDYGRGPGHSSTPEQHARRALRILDGRGQVCPDGKPYAFGTVVAQHKIGPYTVVESYRDHPTWRGGVEELPVGPDADHSFSPFVGEENLGHSCPTLERAIVHAIAYVNLGNPNSAAWATQFAMRVLTEGGE